MDWREQIFSKNEQPFTSFEFLSALEDSGCLNEKSGWLPQYFVYNNADELALLMCFEKSHSYGEYVFDWAWADAYHRNGIHYYPKLICAVPFSPVPCSKWIGTSSLSELDAFLQVRELTQEVEYSSFHYLFPDSSIEINENNWIPRQGHQFHWFNQNEQGNLIGSFEEYLNLMTARKRKNIKKERTKVRQAGFQCYWKNGHEVSASELHHFYHCYHLTYLKRGQSGYLNQEFFQLLCERLGEKVQICFCTKDDNIVAAALYIVGKDVLYGRYWGSLEQTDLLHFEACYYQGIEFAITHKLKVFNPGTQGEHKISRGFKPTLTYSFHHLSLEPFHDAVKQFCREEKHHNKLYMKECQQRLPFKTQE